MDETTKVLIGTLSGFLIAFFAEPVKIYFQDKAKLKNLKLALYKELLDNYWTLRDMKGVNEKELVKFMHEFGIRMECYKNAIQNEVSLFYQLKESHSFNVLYSRWLALMVDMRRGYSQETTDEQLHETFLLLSKGFRELVGVGFYRGNLDKKVLRQLVSPDQYQEWLEVGKEWSEKRVDNPN